MPTMRMDSRHTNSQYEFRRTLYLLWAHLSISPASYRDATPAEKASMMASLAAISSERREELLKRFDFQPATAWK